MRKIITLIALLMTMTSVSAQDPSTWKEGQEVTDELQWAEYDFSVFTQPGSEGAVWQTAGAGITAFNFNEVEMFDKAEGSELYQIFWLPAGVYRFTWQGFYRGSYNPGYWDGSEAIYAVMFAESVNLDEEGNITETTRSTTAKFASIASSQNDQGRLYETDQWDNDVAYNYGGTTYYVPNCMNGTRQYFDAGFYADNSIQVIQTEDGYVRFGVRKTGHLGGDWTIFSNFQAFYVSDAGEAVQLQMAQDEFYKALDDADNYEETLGDFPALNGYYQEAKIDIIDQYDVADGTIESYNEGTAAVLAVMNQYKNYYKTATSLVALVEASESLAASSDYPGLSEFQAAIAHASAVAEDGEDEDMSKWVTKGAEDYVTALNELALARASYLMSKGLSADNSYDFTQLINFPFFCNNEYNPTFNPETNHWEYADEIYNGNGEKSGWSDLGESGDGDNKTYLTTTRILLADKVTISGDTTSILKWYQTNTSGYEPYWNHRMTSAKQWATPGGRREIVQKLIGLPDGYYSIKGMGITWSNDWSNESPADLGIYLEANGKRVESTNEVRRSGWWNYSIDDWTTFTTGMLKIEGGEAKVAFHANGFSSFTGMQLYFFGENPDFTALVKPAVEAALANAENLTLNGDKAAVSAILAQIPETVTGYEAYEAALALVSDANAYINDANSYLAANDPTTLFVNLQGNYEEGSLEYLALDQGITKSFEVYDGPTTTYKDVAEIVADYNAYNHYLNTIAGYADINNAELNALINEQLTALSTAYANAETLEGYEKALAVIYNKAVIGDLSQASETNPIDITKLIINPSFTEGQKGWEGGPVVDGNLQNAEKFNTNFNVFQTIHSLPAGAYEVRVQSYYRDGSATAAFENYWYNDSYNQNVLFYANDRSVPVASIATPLYKERSYTEYYDYAENPEEGGDPIPLRRWVEEDVVTDESGEVTYTVTSWQNVLDNDGNIYEETVDNAWIYDSWVTEGEDRYFYPNSMRGGGARFANDPEQAYTNTIQVMIEEGGTLTFGLKKDTTIEGDWCLFDNFQLFYLGTAVPSSINSIATDSAKKQIFTISGQKVSSMSQPGLYIVNGKKVLVR